MPALVAGNTAVFKPAGDTPEMAWRFAEVFEEAGLPAGVLNVVFGSGSHVGNPLVEHPKVAVISFTGSTDVGLGIAGRGGALGKRISLELRGKNAVLVAEDADLWLATDALPEAPARGRARPGDRGRPAREQEPAGDGELVREGGARGRRARRGRRRARDRWRAGARLLLQAHGLHRRQARRPHRGRGDLRA